MSNLPAFDRSSQNGFRCALYPDPVKIADAAFQMIEFGEDYDIYEERPVPDEIFAVYKEQFSYDKTELNARVESRDESAVEMMSNKVTSIPPGHISNNWKPYSQK
jgi:hypothetical protein